jgi:hypothetical protein
MNPANFAPGMMVGQGMPGMGMQQPVQMMAGMPPQQRAPQPNAVSMNPMNPAQLLNYYNNLQLQIQQREPGSWRTEVSPQERAQFVNEL